MGADRRRRAGAALHRDRDATVARWLALVGAVAGFAVTIPLYVHFTIGTPEMQFVEAVEWIPRFNVNYLLGVDGISLLLVLLNSFITVLVVWAGWEVDRDEGRAVHGGIPDHVRV